MKYVNVWEEPERPEYPDPKNERRVKFEETAEHLKNAAENIINKKFPKF